MSIFEQLVSNGDSENDHSSPVLLSFDISIRFNMVELRGNALLAAVTTLTSLGFLMIGYDNGLLGGLGTSPNSLVVTRSADDSQFPKSMEHHSTRPFAVRVLQSLA